jgi:hypothetical protein
VKTKGNKKPNQKKELSQKMNRGRKKNLTKDNKRKKPNIKFLAHEILTSTLFYLMLASTQKPKNSNSTQPKKTVHKPQGIKRIMEQNSLGNKSQATTLVVTIKLRRLMT